MVVKESLTAGTCSIINHPHAASSNCARVMKIIVMPWKIMRHP
jgi:hypothetical protein